MKRIPANTLSRLLSAAEGRTDAWIARCIAEADREHTPDEIEAAERALACPLRTPAQDVLPLS